LGDGKPIRVKLGKAGTFVIGIRDGTVRKKGGPGKEGAAAFAARGGMSSESGSDRKYHQEKTNELLKNKRRGGVK